jgi:hypothetical protein
MDNDPKHTSKVVAKWFKDNKSRYWGGHHKGLISNRKEMLLVELKKHVRARRPTNLTQLHQLC